MQPIGHEPPRLSALIVSRDEGAFALSCVRSLRRGWLEAGLRLADLDVIVVDNASRTDQRHWFGLLRAEGARLLVQDSDLGFAGGIETAFAASRGGEHDLVALLRPDVVFLPGAVGEIVRHIEAHPEVGAIAPRAFLDEQQSLQHPPLALPGGWSEVEGQLARISTLVARLRAGRRSRAARRWWDAELPHAAPAVDGACLFVQRAVANSLAGVLDRRYLAKYEDADLCRRLRERGLELSLHPRAQVLLHGRARLSDEALEPSRRRELARSSYLGRWSTPFERRVLGWVERLVARLPEGRVDRPAFAVQPVKAAEGPVAIPLAGEQDWWIELARDPLWETRVVGLFHGDVWQLTEETWEWLAGGRWYVRAIDPRGGRVRGAWTFKKPVPARCEAVESLPLHHPEVQHDWIGDLSNTVRSLLPQEGWHPSESPTGHPHL